MLSAEFTENQRKKKITCAFPQKCLHQIMGKDFRFFCRTPRLSYFLINFDFRRICGINKIKKNKKTYAFSQKCLHQIMAKKVSTTENAVVCGLVFHYFFQWIEQREQGLPHVWWSGYYQRIKIKEKNPSKVVWLHLDHGCPLTFKNSFRH